MKLPKIIVLLGPTASGKTDLGLKLAKKFDGEIVSADSRQVYTKMQIGTARPAGVWKKAGGQKTYFVAGVPHHLMDVVDPREDFSVADYKDAAVKCIKEILDRKKLPIVVGGTGLYIQSLIENLDIPKVGPNKELRKQLENKKPAELVKLLQKIDPEAAQKIDLQNPRRVLRALEVFILSGESFFAQKTKPDLIFDVLQIGIDVPRAELFARIDQRVDEQIQDGLVAETAELVKQNYDWNLPSMSGIGYRQIGFYLRGEATLAEAIDILKRDTKRYAKRQMTWFKRDKKIIWIQKPALKSVEKPVKEFLLS